MRNKPDVLINLDSKLRYPVESLGGEDLFGSTIIGLKLLVKTPPKLRRSPLVKATKSLSSLFRIRQTPFRLQLTIKQYNLARYYQANFGVKNPIDEFVKIISIARTFRDKSPLLYVEVKMISNMQAISMMSNLQKEKEKLKRVKNTRKKPKRRTTRSRSF